MQRGFSSWQELSSVPAITSKSAECAHDWIVLAARENRFESNLNSANRWMKFCCLGQATVAGLYT